jgi:hypothetical protein
VETVESTTDWLPLCAIELVRTDVPGPITVQKELMEAASKPSAIVPARRHPMEVMRAKQTMDTRMSEAEIDEDTLPSLFGGYSDPIQYRPKRHPWRLLFHKSHFSQNRDRVKIGAPREGNLV